MLGYGKKKIYLPQQKKKLRIASKFFVAQPSPHLRVFIQGSCPIPLTEVADNEILKRLKDNTKPNTSGKYADTKNDVILRADPASPLLYAFSFPLNACEVFPVTVANG